MNKQISLLDCTLRDGGYINNWEFDEGKAAAIIRSLSQSGMDEIEYGYLTIKGKGGTTLFENLARFNDLASASKVSGRSPKSLLMLNLGEFDISKLPERNAGNNKLDGIRLAFHKNNWKDAVHVGLAIIEKKYEFYVQPMAVGAYSDIEMIDLISAFGKLKPTVFYIVDSFGSLGADDMSRLYYLVHSNLPLQIPIGFHCHNNMQLAYSNTIKFLELNRFRTSFIDSTMHGIGRGAGNLNTEIIQDYLNKNYKKSYDINPILQEIDNYIEGLSRLKKWGYSVSHFLGATRKCHPNYASYLVEKRSLRIKSVKKLLDLIPEDSLVDFDENLIETIYKGYNARKCLESGGISNEILNSRKILIIASGHSVTEENILLQKYIKEKNPFIIAVNHVPNNFKADMIFFSNQKRFNEFCEKISDPKMIAVTSNIEVSDSFKGCATEDYQTLFEKDGINCGNVTILLLNLLLSKGIQKVFIAGLDGYDISVTKQQYSYELFESIPPDEVLREENKKISMALVKISEKMKINILTRSIFRKFLPADVLVVIPARYESSRFLGKPLAPILGIPMLKRTYLQACKANGVARVLVATDDERIYEFCASKDIPVIMTSNSCLTGTDRVAEVAQMVDADLYVNVQGDEPVIDPGCISLILEEYRKYGDSYAAYNMCKLINDEKELEANTIIKVIVNEENELVYMSRSPVPYLKSRNSPRFLKQVCVYGFTKNALEFFASHGKGINEKFEDIEILRFIDNGMKVKMIETEYDSIAVDIPSDIGKVESFLLKGGAK